MGHFTVRTFFSMWVHELGHTLSAWWCGYGAMPGPWVTRIAEERTLGVAALLAAVQGFLAWRAWQTGRRVRAGAFALGVALQLVLGLGLSPTGAQAVITFGGDAGCFVLGTLLMASFYVPREHSLRRGHVRWGLVWIGAAAFADVADTWWAARRNAESIAYGESSAAGLSDPSKLVDTYHWTETELVRRYVSLGVLCALVLAGVYAAGLARAFGGWRALARALARR